MNDTLVIIGIAAFVAAVFIVAWLVAVLRDGRRLRGRAITPTESRWYSVSFKLQAKDDEAARRFVIRQIIDVPAVAVVDELSLKREVVPSRSSTAERVPYKREVAGSTPAGTTDDDTRAYPASDVPGVEP